MIFLSLWCIIIQCIPVVFCSFKHTMDKRIILYLDNCALQALVKNSNNETTKNLLNKDIILLYSFENLLELTQRSDSDSVRNIAIFLKECEIKYLRNRGQLLKRDLSILLHGISNIDWYSDNIYHSMDADYLPGLDLEREFYWYNFYKNNSIDKIIERVHSERDVFEGKLYDPLKVKEWGNQNKKHKKHKKHDYLKTLESLRKDELFKALKQNHINFINYNQKIEESKISDFLSFSFVFYRKQMEHYNATKKMVENDICDITQCAAIPYCDYFVTDRGNASEANKVKTLFCEKHKQVIKCNIIQKLEDIQII